MKSPGEQMEKRRNTDQHVLQHGEIRCEHIYIYIYSYIIYIYIYIYIYISMCFVLFCSYVDLMLVVPINFLILRSETFLALS